MGALKERETRRVWLEGHGLQLCHLFGDKQKRDLFFPFCTILLVLALPRRHRVWLTAASGLGGKCLSKKAEYRPPFVCACIKHSSHLNPAPSSGLWCLLGLLTEQLLFFPSPEAKVLRVTLPAHHGREPRSVLPQALVSLLAWRLWGSRWGPEFAPNIPIP